MSAKQTLSLSKRFVFAVLALAFILVVLSSLLTFSASRKLAIALEQQSETQLLGSELEALPLRMEGLLNPARLYARSGAPEDLARLQTALDEWRLWEQAPRTAPPAGHHHALIDEIEQLALSVNSRLGAIAVIGENGQPRRAARVWVELENEMPGQRLQTLTVKLMGLVREDLKRQAREGAEIAAVHQQTGLGLIALAIALGLIAVWQLGRRMNELETFITVCAWTKRVKYEGRWVPFEEFLEKRFQLKLSHGISDEAALLEIDNLQKPGDGK
ncbi:MAG: hypothetical protein ABII82_02975 [Verrucomicrobiota bacterium]